MTNRRSWWLALSIFLIPEASPAQLNDEGFHNMELYFSPPGSRALAMGGSALAGTSDATAAVSNPAGLRGLERGELVLEYRSRDQTVTHLASQLSLATLETTDFKDSTAGVSLASAVHPFERWTLGVFYHECLRFENAYELEPRFLPGTGTSFFQAIGSVDLRGAELGIAGAFRTGPLRWGVSLRAVTLDVDSRVRHPFPPGLLIDEQASIDGSDSGLGGSLGVLWPISEKLRLGAALHLNPGFEYDQPIERTFAGEVDFAEVRRAAIALPHHAGIGLAYQLGKRWTLAADVVWLGLSRVFENGDLTYPFTGLSAELYEMDDRVELRAGLEYRLSIGRQQISLRAGYSRVPERRLSFRATAVDDPRLSVRLRAQGFDVIHNSQPEETLNGASLGLAFAFNRRWQLDLAASSLEDDLNQLSITTRIGL